MSKRYDRRQNAWKPPAATDVRTFIVFHSGSGWVVRDSGSTQASSVHATQAGAIRAARAAVQRKGGEIRVRGKNGRWTQTFTIGRDSFAQINAVEGMRPTADAVNRASEFDRRELSSNERCRLIVQAYSDKR